MPAETTDRARTHPVAKILIEVGPLGVFFFANAKFGIFAATGAFMVAITLSLTASWMLLRRLPPMALFTAFFVLVMGGLTLWLEDETFIKVKPTIVNTLFALMLAVGLAFGKLLLRFAFGDAFQLTEAGWRAMTVRWIGFFAALAVLNEVVWRSFSTDVWVGFKAFGILPLTILFTLTCLPLVGRHGLPAEAEAERE